MGKSDNRQPFTVNDEMKEYIEQTASTTGRAKSEVIRDAIRLYRNVADDEGRVNEELARVNARIGEIEEEVADHEAAIEELQNEREELVQRREELQVTEERNEARPGTADQIEEIAERLGDGEELGSESPVVEDVKNREGWGTMHIAQRLYEVHGVEDLSGFTGVAWEYQDEYDEWDLPEK